MAPSTSQAGPTAGQAANVNLEMAQPNNKQSMQPTLPSPNTTAKDREQEAEREEVRMRGGEMCPGRFCFIIPCPLPCNCCII
ncbi:hypothetical protein ONS95_008397 [Cadophora gregata]|uniref:uncharacterized protein n=1 Tax=Cadophora gregata TaxID=51156 RepID=UPI0026DC47BB|nr:uncharacterized protein ONS95_008397 [Cadophora gregata]KAK0100447.1 hypothetical protein ONS96_007723 [Cadophora gregata f. sp. sojae]KAK0126818.1 hypothetical protein ONS95_008397 [Cadophora gregata]